MTDSPPAIDPRLVESWLRARSRARGLPQPVADHGGLRVDTAGEAELARYVFARPVDGLRHLGVEIDQPRIFLKLCGAPETLRAMLPDRWVVAPATVMMTRAVGHTLTCIVPDGFTIDVERSDERVSVRIVAADGRLAASGHAAEFDGVYAYDRIRTEAEFRRIGLGRALITALAAERRSPASTEILAATRAGRFMRRSAGASARPIPPPSSLTGRQRWIERNAASWPDPE